MIILKTYIYSNTFSYAKNIKRSLQLASFVRRYRIFVKDNNSRFLLSDQAIVQLFISLAHRKKLLDSPKLISVLKETGLDALPIMVVNCEIDKEISNYRVESRPSNGCRVEGMTEQERIETLDVQMNNFVFIRQKLEEICPNIIQIKVDTSLPIIQSIKQIKSVLLA